MTVTLDSLKKSFGKKKVNTQAFAWLADYEREAGDLDTALQRVDGGLTMYPGDVAARLVRTKILFEKGDFEGCVEECERVLKADPFCLSAQKRMGDAYDRLEKVNERNQCYRKVHDMDPLDKFWKDEYENVIAAAAVAAGADLGEMDLSMPGLDTQDPGAPAEFSMGAPEGEMSFLEKSPEDGAVAEEKGPKFGSGFEFVNQEPAGGTAEPSAEVGLAEPAAFGGLEGSEDDPFAALSALIPDSDAGEEAAMDSLQASLDSAMESINAEEPSAPEVFPSDDDISGNDVNSAMSNFFGADDDLEAEEPAAPASPFSNFNLSASIDDEPAAAAAASNASMVFGTPAEEDQPQSVDSAFNDIFGEDELPEEPSATAAPVEDQPQSVDSAFNDIFGEDELPEEGLFQKSAEVAPEETAAAEELAIEEPVAEPAPAPVEDKPQSVDSAFNDIFGEDDLPEEGLFQKSAEVAPEEPAVAEPVAEELAAEEPVAEDDLALDELPAAVESVESAVEAKSAESSDSVGSAFDSIFGADDDLPEESMFQKSAEVETPAEEPAPAAEPVAAEPVAEEPVEASAELEMPAEESLALESPADASLDLDAPGSESLAAWTPDVKSAAEPAPTVQSSEASEIEAGVGNALDSIFGEDDDLPEETPAAPAVETAPAVEAAPVEETAVAPAPAAKDDLAAEMGGAFDSLFGNDDESTGAAVEERNISGETLEGDLDRSFDNLFGAEDAVAPAAKEPVQPVADLGGLESEVSGAFKGLFESDDDDLPVEKPSNKGVDFLMSGDSDDEVSAGLIKDPSASLENMSTELDESLNTRTLAEIYLEQGLYDKALAIYQDLAKKDPDNQEIQERLSQVRQMSKNKFGD